MAKHLKKGTGTPAIDTIEQAISILRSLPARILLLYYLGTLPFVTGFLYFFTDMSTNPFARENCTAASLGMGLLFAWMKTFQSLFCTRTYGYLNSTGDQNFSYAFILRTGFIQTTIQASSVIILPAALLLTAPFAWTLAVYQMSMIQEPSGALGIRKQLRDNYAPAVHDTFGKHMVLLILCCFSVFIFLNAASAIYAIPFLLKILMGVDTAFSMGGFNPSNTTFLFISAGITYLLTDPVLKAVHVIQKYRFTAARNGNDLLRRLDHIRSSRVKSGLLALVVLCLLMPALPCKSAEHVPGPLSSTPENRISPDQLNTAIQKVLNKREYTWRMPKGKNMDASTGFLSNILKWCVEKLEIAVKMIGNWIESIYHWLKQLFGGDPKPPGEKATPKSMVRPGTLAALLVILLLLLLLAISLYTRKMIHRRKIKPETETAPDQVPDIRDDAVPADALPADQWMEMAKQLAAQKKFRLAMRAVYLSSLAALADLHYLNIAVHKSNMDYLTECSRKASARKQMVMDLKALIHAVDRAWYGMHAVNARIYDDFLSIRKRMLDLAGQ